MAIFDNNNYIEPGVYVESEIKEQPIVGTVGNFVPILVGTLDTHRLVSSDELTVSNKQADILINNQPVLFENIRIKDAYVIYNGSKIISGFTIKKKDDSDNAEIVFDNLTSGKVKVYFYHKRPDTDFDQIKMFYSVQYNEALNYLGVIDVDDDNNVMFTLPLGFHLAVVNGASSVWCIPWNNADGTKKDILTILQKISTLRNPDKTYPYTIVFLAGFLKGYANSELTESDVSQIITHVRTMSSIEEQKERIAIFGPPKDADSLLNSNELYVETLEFLKNKRIVYCMPSNVKITIKNKEVEVGGYLLAAALAGLIDSVQINMPLTGQMLNGINEVVDIKLRSEKNILAQKGALIIENERIRHALTTDTLNPLTSELKVTRIVDYITRLVRNSLQNFVNRPFSLDLLTTISLSIRLILTQLTNTNTIIDYKDISVTRNQTDPRQVDVTFSIRPTLDVNWIYVKFNIEI